MQLDTSTHTSLTELGPRPAAVGADRSRPGRLAAGRRRAARGRSATGRSRWWYEPGWPSGRGGGLALVYAGMALLGLAWLGLGRLVATRDWGAPAGARAGVPHRPRLAPARAAPTLRDLLLIGSLWALPLALGPALFSRDVYSYLAQGTILHLGPEPLPRHAGRAGSYGQGHVLSAVSPFWRHTPAPYGPLFLGLVSVIVGDHRVAPDRRRAGHPGRRAGRGRCCWPCTCRGWRGRSAPTRPGPCGWRLMSPLVLLELVAAGHNDMLMIGLLAAGGGRRRWRAARCSGSRCAPGGDDQGARRWPARCSSRWRGLRAEPSSARAAPLRCSARRLIAAGGAGGGQRRHRRWACSWISSTRVLDARARCGWRSRPAPASGGRWRRCCTTSGRRCQLPQRRVGVRRGGGRAHGRWPAPSLLYRTRVSRARAGDLGVFLVLAAAGGPAAWPWYFTWGLVLRGGLPGPQRSWPLAVALAVSVFVVKPGGILALPLDTAPAVLAVYVLIAGRCVWRRGACRGTRGRGRRDTDAGAPRPATSALADGAPSPAGENLTAARAAARPRRARRATALAVGLPAVLAAVLCAIGITGRSLGFDEAATVTIASQHGSALWSAIAHDGGNMSGYYLLLHLLIGAFGNGLCGDPLGVRAGRRSPPWRCVGADRPAAVRSPGAFAAGAAGRGQPAAGLLGPERARLRPDGGVRVRRLPGLHQRWPGPAGRAGAAGAHWVAYVVFMSWRSTRASWRCWWCPAQLALLLHRRRLAAAARGRAGGGRASCASPLVVLATSRGSSQLFWVPRPTRKVETQVLQSLTSAGLQPSFHRTAITTPLLIADPRRVAGDGGGDRQSGAPARASSGVGLMLAWPGW